MNFDSGNIRRHPIHRHPSMRPERFTVILHADLEFRVQPASARSLRRSHQRRVRAYPAKARLACIIGSNISSRNNWRRSDTGSARHACHFALNLDMPEYIGNEKGLC